MTQKKFRICNKREFLLTYSNDYLGILKIEHIEEFFKNQNTWNYTISCEKGHEKGDIHTHFHVYLKYKGPNKNGFSCRGQNAQNIWDINLKEIIYYNYTIDNEGNRIRNYTKDKLRNIHQEIEHKAHCNIKFKGDKTDENCKNTYKMLDYVTKQRKDFPKEEWKILSNFNWEKKIDELIKIYEQTKNMRFYAVNNKGEVKNESRVDNLEYQFTSWLRLQITTTTKTVEDIKDEIVKNEDFFFIYSKRKNTYDSIIFDFVKIRDTEKPKPDWEKKYIIPKILKDFINTIDNWVKLWYNAEEDEKGYKIGLPERPKGLWLTSDSRSGKTNLGICLGPFNYFNSMWNLINYSYSNPINIFDDFTGEIDTNDFVKLKPWIGAQYTFTVSDKFIKKVNIINGKPLIWLSNKPLEKQVLDEDDRNYIKKNMTVIQLGQYDLYTPKDTRTIGGYTSWVNWDPKSTWYYNNIIKNLESNENASENDITEEQNSTAQLLNDETAEIIEISSNSSNNLSDLEIEDIPIPGSNSLLGRRIRESTSKTFETKNRNKKRKI